MKSYRPNRIWKTERSLLLSYSRHLYQTITQYRLYVDSSDSITPPLVEGAVNQGQLLGLGADNPVIVDKIYGDITYLQFFGVGVIMMAIFTSTMFGGGIALYQRS